MADNGELFPAATPDDVTMKQKIDELTRELKMRHKVYPNLVGQGRLGQNVARDRILVLRAILNDYKAMAERS